MKPARRIRPVLLVEDNPDHALLVQRAFQEVGAMNPVRVAAAVDDAIAYLAGSSPYEDRSAYPLPALVVLDLVLLGGSGLDVLDWIRDRPEMGALPVVVLTVSGDLETRERAYGFGALDYVVKRRSFKQLVATVRDWTRRWLPGEPADERGGPESRSDTGRPGAALEPPAAHADDMSKSIRPVLVIDEDPEQGLLVQIGFQEAWVRNPVVVLLSAELGIAYLAGELPYDDRKRHPLPALLLLSLAGEASAGMRVLEWLARRPFLRSIPVVALVDPRAPELHERAYRLGASICVMKPTNPLDLVPRIQQWARFWLGALEERGEAESA